MRLVFTFTLAASLLCGAGVGYGFGASARAGQDKAKKPPAAAPTLAKGEDEAQEAAVDAEAEPGAEAKPSTELDAVLETAAAKSLAANTPMHEGDAALHLARAWRAVVDSPPSEQTLAVLWAHWAHETGRGQRMHAYNFAGIKGRGPSGASVVVWTREGSGSSDLVRRTFRAYRTPNEGARDYVRLLATRYPSALRAARDGNARSFVDALDSGGYFTADPRAYLRAVSSLSSECRRRGLSEVATARGARSPATTQDELRARANP